MASSFRLWIVFLFSLPVSVSPIRAAAEARQNIEPQTIRCAVIGGMMDTRFWPELCKRFEASSGHRVEVVAAGPKQIIRRAFVDGRADLIVMHASDTMINLVADGYGVDPQPWARNDLVLVGPPGDPAGIRGMTDAVKAVRKIVQGKNTLLIHRSLGAQGVLSNLMGAGQVEFDPQHTLVYLSKDRQMLLRASRAQAYAVVGRVPFLNGKIPKGNLTIMVQGDPRLMRPYLVVVAGSTRPPQPRAVAARRLARYLREPETQAWISGYGRGKLDGRPLFFPVNIRTKQ